MNSGTREKGKSTLLKQDSLSTKRSTSKRLRAYQRESALHLTQDSTLPAVPAARPGPMPSAIEPMKAKLVDQAFSDPEWLFEFKWDGVRAICFIDGDTGARFMSRNQKDLTSRYPELSEIARWVNAEQAILDGEIVALDRSNSPSFQRLQTRLGLENRKEIEQQAQINPVVFFAFDLLYYNGFDLTPAELIHRKAFLSQILETSHILRLSEHVQAEGKALYKKVQKLGLEGIIAKHCASPYQQKRSDDWLKIKRALQQEVVIAGYTQPRGRRKYLGSLVVGLYDKQDLQFVGHVGGGFDQSQLERVYRLLQPLKIPQSPFKRTPPANEPVQWVKPVLICEVKFAEWTRDRRLRQPIYLGLRDDKEPAECTFEVKRDTRLELTKVESNAALRGPFEHAKTGSAIDTIDTAKRNSQRNSSEPGKSTQPYAGDHSESKKKSRAKQTKSLNRRRTS